MIGDLPDYVMGKNKMQTGNDDGAFVHFILINIEIRPIYVKKAIRLCGRFSA